MFLEECKYVVKGKKIPKYIIDDIKISSDSDRENSDEESSDESVEENLKILTFQSLFLRLIKVIIFS